jgi:hypothetical protein
VRVVESWSERARVEKSGEGEREKRKQRWNVFIRRSRTTHPEELGRTVAKRSPLRWIALETSHS